MNNFMILCTEEIVSFDYWLKIYERARLANTDNFGYGIRLNTKDFKELEDIRKDLPFRDHFFFLISNRKKREFPIHVDGIPGNKNAASVNWPLKNCNSLSPTAWYSCQNPVFKNIDNSFFLDNVDDATVINSEAMLSEYGKPYLFRSDILHRGYCNSMNSDFRIIVKWELDFNDWSTACSEFQNRNYI